MCEEPTPVTAEHLQYVAKLTRQEGSFLQELKEEAKAAGIPSIWISPEQASFMQILLKTRAAREVVEVGTLAGYSAIAMARALPPGGRVRTIEITPLHAEFAESWVRRSDVGEKVQVYRGAGAEVLKTFADNSADAAFIDADKENYTVYLQECLRIVRPNGLIMIDNAFAFGQLFDEQPEDNDVQSIRAFNELVPKIEGLHSIIVPIGDGLWVGVYSGGSQTRS